MKCPPTSIFALAGVAAGIATAEMQSDKPIEISPTSNSALILSPTSKTAFTIKHCHVGDVALIHDELGGTTITTNVALIWSDFSMLNVGSNLLAVQTVCMGVTSKISMKLIFLQREPPAPELGGKRLDLPPPPPPPIPWGMTVALPNAGNPKESYSDFTNRIQSGMRRSQ